MADVAELTICLDAVLDALGLTDGVHMMGISYGPYAAAESRPARSRSTSPGRSRWTKRPERGFHSDRKATS